MRNTGFAANFRFNLNTSLTAVIHAIKLANGSDQTRTAFNQEIKLNIFHFATRKHHRRITAPKTKHAIRKIKKGFR